MSLPAKYRQLPASIKLFSPFVGVCIGLWTIGTVCFAGFSLNTLEKSARASTTNIATFLSQSLETEQELLRTKAEIIGKSALIETFSANGFTPQQTRALSLLKQSQKIDFIQVFNPQNNDLLTTTINDQVPATYLSTIEQGVNSSGDFQTGFFLSENGKDILLLATVKIESENNNIVYILTGKTLNKRRLNAFKQDANLQLVLLNSDQVAASTLILDERKKLTLKGTKNTVFWQRIAGKDYLIKSLNFDTINQKKITLALLNPAEATENAEIQLWVITALFSLLGIAALFAVISWSSKAVQLLTQRIETITNATASLSQGNSHTLIDIDSEDDFGRLANSFNVMADKLQVRERELQEKVALLKDTLRELNQTQNQIIQSEKMSALGQMVAGVAHEINNPLSFIHGNLPHVQTYCEELLEAIAIHEKQNRLRLNGSVDSFDNLDLTFIRKDLPKTIESIQIGADRIQAIVKLLRTFSRLDESRYKDVNIHESIDSTLMIVQHRLRAIGYFPEIDIKKEYGDLPMVECFAGELNQVFLHIINNAIDAIHEKYHADQNLTDEAICEEISITTTKAEAGYIQVAIANTGIPINRTLKDRLFDPFFSTKPIGKATGLGLSISYQIIHDIHQGEIWYDLNGDRQTVFYLKIPIKQLSSAPVSQVPQTQEKDDDYSYLTG